jgi:hypothetical protein
VQRQWHGVRQWRAMLGDAVKRSSFSETGASIAARAYVDALEDGRRSRLWQLCLPLSLRMLPLDPPVEVLPSTPLPLPQVPLLVRVAAVASMVAMVRPLLLRLLLRPMPRVMSLAVMRALRPRAVLVHAWRCRGGGAEMRR